jgi:hypothetical protein
MTTEQAIHFDSVGPIKVADGAAHFELNAVTPVVDEARRGGVPFKAAVVARLRCDLTAARELRDELNAILEGETITNR